MVQKRSIAVVVPPLIGYFSRVLEGLCAYVLDETDWEIEFCRGYTAFCIYLEDSKPAGVLVHLSRERTLALLDELSLPTVNISSSMVSHYTRVGVDDMAVAELAAQHLLDCGLQQFGYCGYNSRPFSECRRESFIRFMDQQGFQVSCHNLGIPPFDNQAKTKRELCRWLERLPKPAGIFVATDESAFHVLRSCRDMHIRVPEEIAIIGVDNDSFFARFATPPLSSIDIPAEAIGYEAARLLELMMDQGLIHADDMILPPLRVVKRQSTDVVAVSDKCIADAVRYIRETIRQPIGVDDIANQVSMNRRTLERRFRELLGRSPAEELRRQRVECASQLLMDTNMKMEEVARRCGISSGPQLSLVFRKETGLTPSEFRAMKYRLVDTVSKSKL